MEVLSEKTKTRSRSRSTKPKRVTFDAEHAERIVSEINASSEDSLTFPAYPMGRSFTVSRLGEDFEPCDRWHTARVYGMLEFKWAVTGNKRGGKARVLFRFFTDMDGGIFAVDADYEKLVEEYGEQAASNFISDLTGLPWQGLVEATEHKQVPMELDEVAEVMQSAPPPDRTPKIAGWGSWG